MHETNAYTGILLSQQKDILPFGAVAACITNADYGSQKTACMGVSAYSLREPDPQLALIGK